MTYLLTGIEALMKAQADCVCGSSIGRLIFYATRGGGLSSVHSTILQGQYCKWQQKVLMTHFAFSARAELGSPPLHHTY